MGGLRSVTLRSGEETLLYVGDKEALMMSVRESLDGIDAEHKEVYEGKILLETQKN